MPTHASPPAPLAGRRALVTGASSGLGARFARVLAAAGAEAILAARRTDRLATLAAAIEAEGGRARAVTLDVADPESVRAAFAAAGDVDIVINNAGMNAGAMALDLTAEDWDRVMAVNLRGVFLVAQEAARRMIAAGARERRHGRIVNIASIGAHTVLPGLTAYCTSKAAVVMLTRALAREWARLGVSVNAICPGYVETELNSDWLNAEGGKRMIEGFPRKRLMREEDLDAALLLLAGDAAHAITGSILTVDDGQSL